MPLNVGLIHHKVNDMQKACCGPTVQAKSCPVQAVVWLHLTVAVCSSLTMHGDDSRSL